MPSRRQAAITAWTALVVACAGPEQPGEGAEAGPADGEAATGEVLVSAASSLTDAFRAVEAELEAAQPGLDVVLNLGGSSSLRAQILAGAPVDVFASADAETMERLVEAGEVAADEPRVFARTRLLIAVPAGNPGRVARLDDLADRRLRVGLCAAEVPCGGWARTVLERADVEPAVDTNEPNARALLTKIELGELDAGLTYASDVRSAGDAVRGIDIPDAVNASVEYPIAVLERAPNSRAARAFVDFVVSDAGRAILASHGFTLP